MHVMSRIPDVPRQLSQLLIEATALHVVVDLVVHELGCDLSCDCFSYLSVAGTNFF